MQCPLTLEVVTRSGSSVSGTNEPVRAALLARLLVPQPITKVVHRAVYP